MAASSSQCEIQSNENSSELHTTTESKTMEQNSQQAEKLKEKANERFKNLEFNEAIELYTQAIELNPNVAAYYANRSFSYLKTECFGYALADASKALELDPKYIKAYYRRASANMALGKFKLALKDFEAVSNAKPNDRDAKAKYKECDKIVKRIAFEKAISVEEKQSIADKINIETMEVESSYDGPVLDNSRVTPDFMKNLLEAYRKQKKLHKKYAYQILLAMKNYLETLPSLIDVNIPTGAKFTVCGDIHGQFYDLLNIFELNGLPSKDNPYLFNGDFVDRGSFSVECVFTLFGFKLLYPDHFFLSRGNHESITMNQMYGFAGEVKCKYSMQMADLFTEVYNWLPLAHCLSSRILVTHGGLFAEDGVTLDDIRKVDRNRQPPDSGIMCELLWSDPQPQNGRSLSKRGVGCQFGPDVTDRFLKLNRLDYIIRSHEVKADGYEVAHNGKCITVFSAPNYCDQMGNKGAFINLIGGDLKPKFTSYEAVNKTSGPIAMMNSFRDFSTDALCNAAADGNIERFEEILKKTKNLNATNEKGWTALMFAARNGRHEIIDIILKNGGDEGLINHNGQTALDIAKFWNHTVAQEQLSKKTKQNKEFKNFFSSNPLDRHAHMRPNSEWIEKFSKHPDTVYLVFHELTPLLTVTEDNNSLAQVSYDKISSLISQDMLTIFLGVLHGDQFSEKIQPYFAINLSQLNSDDCCNLAKDAFFVKDSRMSLMSLPEDQAGIAAQARSLLAWHDRNKFCSTCGTISEVKDGGHKRQCTNDSCRSRSGVHNTCYPRTDPTVIMAVTSPDKTRLLLGSNLNKSPDYYSCLAGFIESGETIEDAVRREVWEETGIKVGRVQYHSSQPWPMPASLMLGCLAFATTEEIKVDETELRDARWFSREEVAQLLSGKHPNVRIPPSQAIAHNLIKAWLSLVSNL
ncbi:DgyrCDS1439 [Dimorphilus gyrociliatus]|uniref:NAD-capped RNA hydrolase NUDT12 n=1 Tax=Dimorphilus gyrociliatus TaxID=2664684 RepID=A0A7I8V953_9ANNE|nr:DgyrCDS1439 [Dimorphilus gyrociliatus]